jgi:hypothetical protein
MTQKAVINETLPLQDIMKTSAQMRAAQSGIGVLAAIRFLLVLLVVLSGAIFFAYPPLVEESSGECSALEERVANLASHDASGLLTVGPLYGSSSSSPSGAAYVKDRYQALPTEVGCAVAYWKAVFDPQVFAVSAAAQASLSPEPPVAGEPAGAGLASIISRDITPNGDPISPATIFTLPMNAVAVRVDYPATRAKSARFLLSQGRAVLASCKAETSAPSTAWCEFNVSLRKGNYSISFADNNVLLGQFPFTVIGR